MNINQIRQATSWAIAMNQVEPREHKGEGVYLSYDNIPSLGDYNG